MKPFINFFYTICMHLHFFFFGEKKQTQSLHRKLTWRDDNYRDLLPFLMIIIVITVIVILLSLISATEANIYYYHLGGA